MGCQQAAVLACFAPEPDSTLPLWLAGTAGRGPNERFPLRRRAPPLPHLSPGP
jgi:hypothetical protein